MGLRRRPGTGKALTKIAPLGLVLVLLALPSAMAGPVGPARVETAPYHLAAFRSYDSVVTNGSCAHATIPVASHFYPRTGIGGFALDARASSCGPQTVAQATGFFTVNFTIAPPPSGTGRISVNWTFNATMSVSLALGNCSASSNPLTASCRQVAVYELGPIGFQLYDLTTGSYVSAATHEYPPREIGASRYTTCVQGSCFSTSTNHTGTKTYHLTATSHVVESFLNSSHQYGIVFFVAASASVSFTGPISGASGAVRVVATPGLDLRWVSAN